MAKEKTKTPAEQGGGLVGARPSSQLEQRNKMGSGVRIVRAPRERQFEVIDHQLLRDSSLSFRARGVAARLLSNVDGYTMTSEDLAREGREGRDAIRASLRELEKAGYLRRTSRQVERGRWITEVLISDKPFGPETRPTEDGFPVVGQPAVGQPVVGQPAVGGPVPKSTSTNTRTICTGTSTGGNRASAQLRASADRKATYQKPSGKPRIVHGVHLFPNTDDEARFVGVSATNAPERIKQAAAAVLRLDRGGRPVALLSAVEHWLRTNPERPTAQMGPSQRESQPATPKPWKPSNPVTRDRAMKNIDDVLNQELKPWLRERQKEALG